MSEINASNTPITNIADPTIDGNPANKRYLESHVDVRVTGQIDGTLLPAVVNGAVYICTKTGGAYTEKRLYRGESSAWVEYIPGLLCQMKVSVALIGGNQEYAAMTVYLWNGTSWVVDAADTAAAAAAVATHAGTGGTHTIKDTFLSIVASGDVTKILQFLASGIAHATTRTWTIPDKDITIAGLDDIATHAGLTQTHGAAAGEVLPAMVAGLAGVTKAAAGKLVAAVQNTDYVTRDITGAVTQTFAGSANAGVDTALSISPTHTQTGTAGSTDLYINRTDTGLGSGAHYFANFCVATVQKYAVTNQGKVIQAALLNADTGDSYAYNLEYTTNKLTSGDDYGLRINQTDTRSPGTSYLAWFGVGGTANVTINNDGNIHTRAGYGICFTADTLYRIVANLGVEYYAPTNNGHRFIINTIEQVCIGASNGYLGIRTAIDGYANPTYPISLGGNAARTIGMERHTTANTAGNNLTVNAGGATLLATDKAGGTLNWYPGVPTGQGLSGQNFYAYGAQAVVGGVVTATLNAGGSGYVATETATITNGANDATWRIDTVDGSGKALTGHMVAAGTTCTCVTGAATTGGSGTGLKINITKTTRETDNTAVLALTLSALAVTTTLTSVAAYFQTSTAPTANSIGTVWIFAKDAGVGTANAGWMPLKTNAGAVVYVPYWT